MSGNREKLIIPKEFFNEQVHNVARSAKDAVEAKRDKFLDNTDNLKRAIDALADMINKAIRRIVRGEGITDKRQLETLCATVRDEISRDKALKHYNATDIQTIVDKGLTKAVKEMQNSFGHIIAQLPEGEPEDQREAFFQELAACGVEEEDALEEIMAKLNSMSFHFTPDFFKELSKFGFDNELSSAQVREIKQLFNTVSGKIRGNINGHIQRNPKLTFDVLRKNIIEALDAFNFKPSELNTDIIEKFKKTIIIELKQYLEAAHSLRDLWALTSDSREETITCREIQARLIPDKVAYIEDEDAEKESCPISAAEQNFILRLYIGMDRGLIPQTCDERSQAIADELNNQIHAGLDLRTARDVARLIDGIPSYGSDKAESGKPSAIIDLMGKIDGLSLGPRQIGQALVRFREGLAREVEKFHTLRTPDSLTVNRLNEDISRIKSELDQIEKRITELLEQINERYERLSILSELAILRAKTGTGVEESQLRTQSNEFEQYLQMIKELRLTLERIGKIEVEIEEIRRSLLEINENIDRGELFIRSGIKEQTFGADPQAILGDEYRNIFEYESDKDVDLKLGSTEMTSDQCMAKIAEIKLTDAGKILHLAEQVATAFTIVKEQLGEEIRDDLISGFSSFLATSGRESLEHEDFPPTLLHTLLHTTAMGNRNRIWGIEEDMLPRVLHELSSLTQIHIEELGSVTEVDPSCTNKSKKRRRPPDNSERANSEKLFIKWTHLNGTTFILPTHKAFEATEGLPAEFQLSEKDKVTTVQFVKDMKKDREA